MPSLPARYSNMPYDLLVVVPYRDRLEHLKVFAPALVAHLEGKQTVCILVVEQTADSPFNRGKLINVGFREGYDLASHLVMHDVDMVPQDESCDYSPHPYPMHLAGCASQYYGKLPYDSYVGGVMMMRMQQFQQINGFGNDYWGWGREDDELWLRIKALDLRCDRRPGRYRSLPHLRSARTAANDALFLQSRKGYRDYRLDGVKQTQYKVVHRERLASFLGQDLPVQHEIMTVDLQYKAGT